MKVFQGKTFLIVDDEQEIRELLRDEFEYFGATVLDASNGKLAADVLSSTSVDVIVSDIRMHGGDGIELLKWVKGVHLTRPIVLFMSAFSDVKLDEVYEMGADAIFAKPFSLEKLRSKVLELLKPQDERWSKPLDENPSQKVLFSPDHLKFGRGGFFAKLPPGLIIDLSTNVSFLIQSEKNLTAIEGQGCVRWTRNSSGQLPDGIGIEILFLEDKDRKVIVDRIQTTTPKAFIPRD